VGETPQVGRITSSNLIIDFKGPPLYTFGGPFLQKEEL
jgi:hypothetical protein